ncbi:MAG: FAD-dependent oxidoreductase [Thermoleophilia bacterium]|nr:FAD-dependent oxidoreductase [Thermoleophilia bacterium]
MTTGGARSLWLADALAGAEDAPSLEGDERADICIVGGGYTGLWTALRLKELEPALDVVVVEADVCGGGASGRNGGFVLSWWAKFEKLEHLCGGEEAVRLARASAEAVVTIGEFCRRNGIDAHYRHDGWLWTATNAAQVGAWESTLAAIERHGVEAFARLEPREVARRSGSSEHLAGVLEPTGATVQPALLARGLRRVAIERGVRIFERSRMCRLERSRPPRVHTARGSVTAERVVLAMNAWLQQISEVASSLFVITSDVVATDPIPDRLAEIGWTDGVAISDSRLLVNYYRTTLDGRVTFGQGGGAFAFGKKVGAAFEGAAPPGRAERVAASFRSLYPALADVPTPRTWTGPVDRSWTGIPFFAPLGGRPDIVLGAGYSGNGVGPSYLGGRILASLALGRDDEWAQTASLLPPRGGVPPEPIRYLGGRLVRAAVARKERAEDAGKSPGALTRRMAALAPAGLVPLKKR